MLACGVPAAHAAPTTLPLPTPSSTSPTPTPTSSGPSHSPDPSHSPTHTPTHTPSHSPSPTRTPGSPTSSTASATPTTSAHPTPSGHSSSAGKRHGKKPGNGQDNKLTLLELKAAARAQAAKNRADHKVATLAERIAAQAAQVQQRSVAASQAEQQYVAQLGVDAQARAAATQAAQRVAQARADLHSDQQTLAAAAAAAYETYTGPDSLGVSTLGTLLVADDPNAVLDTNTEQRMLVAHQVGIIGQVKLALQTLRAAEQQQAAAEVAVSRETARLASLHAEAEAALTDARRTIATLTAALSKAKVSQRVADAALSTFLGGWSTRRSEARRRAEPRLREARAAEQAPQARAGRTAVDRRDGTDGGRTRPALHRHQLRLGRRERGRTRRPACAHPATRTSTVTTSDSTAPGSRSTDGRHTCRWRISRRRSTTPESVHPAPDALLPGDLVFWSSDGTAAGIHHVAIYVGDGNVIQAPESGDIVRITPLGAVSSGYFGATRPLT